MEIENLLNGLMKNPSHFFVEDISAKEKNRLNEFV